jgi:hypothetical protein
VAIVELNRTEDPKLDGKLGRRLLRQRIAASIEVSQWDDLLNQLSKHKLRAGTDGKETNTGAEAGGNPAASDVFGDVFLETGLGHALRKLLRPRS